MAERAKAQIDLIVNDKEVDSALKEAESSFRGFGKTATVILGTVAAAFAFNRLYSFGEELLEIAGIQEQAEQRLQSVLEATNHVAGFTIDQLKGVASAYQSITTVGDEVILNTQAVLATFKNIRGKEFTDATMAILDMSEVLGQDAKAGAVQLGKALNDPILGVTALNRVGIQFTKTQKEQITLLQQSNRLTEAQRIILDEVTNQMGGSAVGAAQTFTGQMKQIENSWGDLKEEGGFLIAEVLKPMLPSMRATVELLMEMATAMKPLAQQIGETAAEWLSWETDVDSLVDTLMEWWAISTTLFARIDDVVASGLLRAGAEVVDFGDVIKYQFTEVLPWAFETMWEVAKQVFSRFGEFISVVLDNTAENIDRFARALKSKMTGGDFNFTPVNPLKGFELELEKLPELGERKVNETVERMREAARDLEDDIGVDIAKAVADARAKKENFEPLDLEGDPAPFEVEAKIDEDTVLKAKLENDELKVTNEESEDSTGLVEFFDKIAASARQSDPDWQVVEAVDRTTEAVEQSIEAIKALKMGGKVPDFAPEHEEDPLAPETIERMLQDAQMQLLHANENLQGDLREEMVERAEEELDILKDALKAAKDDNIERTAELLAEFDKINDQDQGDTPEARNPDVEFERPNKPLFLDEVDFMFRNDPRGLNKAPPRVMHDVDFQRAKHGGFAPGQFDVNRFMQRMDAFDEAQEMFAKDAKPEQVEAQVMLNWPKQPVIHEGRFIPNKVDVKVEQDKVVRKLDDVVSAINEQDTTARFGG